MHRKHSADIGIIGGTGIYTAELFDAEKQVKVYTPYGQPSDLINIGEFGGRTIAFIPRHGRGHTIPPHRINSRANIWALREIWCHTNNCPICSRKFEAGIQARRNCHSRPVYRLYKEKGIHFLRWRRNLPCFCC